VITVRVAGQIGSAGAGGGTDDEDGPMAADQDALQEAVDDLYSADPEGFMPRRAELSAAAKKAGDPALAKQIGALRKPTRSAFTINKLAREDPDAVAELLDLGSQLRDAERSVDAKQIRELTARRRRLLDELTRRSFEVTGESSPSSALRDEVVSTLTAALADDSVADQLADGILIKPARWEGFGFGGEAPDLTLVHSAPARPKPPPRQAVKAGATKEEKAASRRAAAEAAASEKAAEQAAAKAAAEAAKKAKLDEAVQAAEDAEEAVILATDEEQTRLERLRALEEQVAEARRDVDEARIQLRRAEIRQRRTRDALDRLQR